VADGSVRATASARAELKKVVDNGNDLWYNKLVKMREEIMEMKKNVAVMEMGWKMLVMAQGSAEKAAQYLEDKAVREYGFEHPTTIEIFKFTEAKRRG
jgi:hypothetical protein